MLIAFIALSSVLQLMAAVLALRMIRITGKPWAWSLIAGALSLMIIRRGISLYQAMAQGGQFERSDLVEELVGLAIAAAMVVGMAGIGPIFRSIQANASRLSRSREQYRALLDQAGDGIFVSDGSGNFLEVNPRACDLLGYTREELLRLGVRDTLMVEEPDTAGAMLEGLSPGNPILKQQLIRKKSGGPFPAELSISQLTDGRIQAIVRDVSERQKAEEALRDSEERFRRTFDEAPIGVTLVSTDLRFLRANAEFSRFIQYSEEELKALSVRDIVPPEDWSPEPVRHVLSGQTVRYQAERQSLRKDGQTAWGRLSVSAVRDGAGKPLYLIAMMEDIAERRESEARIQKYQRRLRALSTRLTVAEERERHRIAGALHDDLGQVLALAKMKLGALRRAVTGTRMEATAEEARALIDQAILSSRNLTFDLSPPVLYELGFEAAVEWLGERVEEDSGIVFHLNREGPPPFLREELAVFLFRAVRELLNNVIKHSGAKSVTVTVQRRGGEAEVIVRDDGAGLGTAWVGGQMDWTRGFGLFSIRERLEDLGGRLEVESCDAGGAEIRIWLPVGRGTALEEGRR